MDQCDHIFFLNQVKSKIIIQEEDKVKKNLCCRTAPTSLTTYSSPFTKRKFPQNLKIVKMSMLPMVWDIKILVFIKLK